MNKQTEALKMAIERLQISNELLITGDTTVKNEQAIQACKEALEPQTNPEFDVVYHNVKQPTQEPLTRAQQVIRANNSAQEPMAWLSENSSQVTKWKDIAQSWIQHGGKAIPLYTHPEPSWQGLSDDEFKAIMDEWSRDGHPHTSWGGAWRADGEYITMREFVRAIEQALKDKNT